MKRFLFIMTFCILGMTVVKGVSTDASVYKSGEDEVKCGYSCAQDVAVCVPSIFERGVIDVNSDWIKVHNTVYVRSHAKKSMVTTLMSLPCGYIKPPDYTKYINDCSPTNKGKTKVTTGGSGGMPYHI